MINKRNKKRTYNKYYIAIHKYMEFNPCIGRSPEGGHGNAFNRLP